MPGIVRNRVDTGLESAPEQGFYAVAEWRYMSNIAADDSNTVRAPSYAVTVVNSGYKWLIDAWTQDLVGRVDNLFDYMAQSSSTKAMAVITNRYRDATTALA
ncbi:hypothetical protein A8L51_04015 [Pantoea stewartii]|nr:hypothetical protein [Pantoea stewartii]